METGIQNDIERLPPHSVDAEAAVIGSLLASGRDRSVFAEVAALVSRESFYQLDHQVYFETIKALHEDRKPIDALLVREDLTRRGVFVDVGGSDYLHTLIGSVGSSAHAAHYAGIVQDRYLLRCVITSAESMIRRAYAPAKSDNAGDIARDAITTLARLSKGAGKAGPQRLDAVLGEVVGQMRSGGVPMVTTGFKALDDLGGGVGLGEMMLIGARPSMGKSTIAKQMALRAAKSGVPAAIISLEEGRFKMGRNILASEARVDNHKIRKATELSAEDWHEIEEGVTRLGDVPLYMTDGVRRLQDIAAEAALMVSRYGIKLLVIDYLQRVEVSGKTDYERAGMASTGVSDLLKDLNVAGIIPVQLNRALEQRDDKRPRMDDLRDSGRIEQDADIIVFLHREDYFHNDDPNYTPTGEAELIVGKWRDGLRGATIRLKSNLRYQTFEDQPVPDPFGTPGIGPVYVPGGFNADDL